MSLLRAFVALLSVASAAYLPPNEIFARGNEGQCAVTPQNQPEWYERNLRTVRKIYDMTVYPNNVPVLLKGGAAVPKGLFSENTKGRVSPVGDFVGFEDSIEYFFALAPTPQSNPAGTAFYDAQVVNFVSGCPDVAASLVYFRSGQVSQTGELNRSAPTTTLSQVAFWKFNAKGEVEDYQAWIPNLQAWTKISSGVDYSNMQVQAAATQGLCPVIQQRCTGANQQYSSVQDCAQQLGAKPFGNFDEAWGDNVACRTIHLILTMVHPEVHCPHVGPTGGGKCVDIDYSVDYFDDDKLYGVPIGSLFTCSGPLQPDNQVGAGPGAAQVFQQLAQAAASGQLPPAAAAMMGGGAGGTGGTGGAGGAGGQGGGFNPLGNSGGGGSPNAAMAGSMQGQQGMTQGAAGQMPNAAMAGAAGGMPQAMGAGGMPQGTAGQISPATMGGAMGGGMPHQGGVPAGYCPCAPGQQPSGNMASPASGMGGGMPQGIQPAGMGGGHQPAQPQGQASPAQGTSNAAPQSYGGSAAASPAQQEDGLPHIGGDINGAHAPPNVGYHKEGDESGSQHSKKWLA